MTDRGRRECVRDREGKFDMLFDDYAFDYGAASAPVDLHGTDAGHGASGIAAAATANDDWLLGTGLPAGRHSLAAGGFGRQRHRRNHGRRDSRGS
jgi:hypothetical protein